MENFNFQKIVSQFTELQNYKASNKNTQMKDSEDI